MRLFFAAISQHRVLTNFNNYTLNYETCTCVIPAHAGIQNFKWIPAYAGMTQEIYQKYFGDGKDFGNKRFLLG